MLFPLLIAASLQAAMPARPDTTVPTDGPSLAVTVDSIHDRIEITVGPFDLPAMPANMDMDEMEHDVSKVMPFAWPVDGYLHGFNVTMQDAAGKPLPNSILHHLIGVNFNRRQLVYRSVERLFGWGSETAPVNLPDYMGVPLALGTKLGMYAMFHNETGKDIPAAYLHVSLLYTPRQGHHVLPIMPFYVDVNNHVGGVTTFDVPPGHSAHSYTFELPISGRLVGIGGHLHNYGSSVTLKDGVSGKVLGRLKAKRDDNGDVEGVGRFIFGFNSDALPLEAHHPYVVTAEYDNPTADTIKDGGMGHMNGAFVPDEMSQWPKLDRNDPMIQKDVAALPLMQGMATQSHGRAATGMKDMPDMPMMNHGHPMKPDSTMPQSPADSSQDRHQDH